MTHEVESTVNVSETRAERAKAWIVEHVRHVWMVMSLVILILLWEVAIKAFDVSPFVLPAPSRILTALLRGLDTGVLQRNAWITLQETLVGFLFASLVGITLGALLSQSRFAEAVIMPYLVASQTFPKIAIAPLFIIWFGFGMTSKIVIAALVAFFPVLVNTMVGLNAADPDQIALMRSLSATRWQIIRRVQIPNALPYIFAGLDMAIVFSVLGAIVGEFVGAQGGLGYLIRFLNFQLDMAGVFAALVFLSVMGFALHYAVKAISDRVVFWMPKEDPWSA